MKLAADQEIAAWLATGPAVEWGPLLFAGRLLEPEHEEARYLILGATSDGRPAALIFARLGDKCGRSVAAR